MNIADRPKLYRELRRVLKPGGLLAFYDVVSIDGPAAPLYPLPWSETPATGFLLTREATLDAIGASGFVMQAERGVSQEALGWFQRIIGAAPQGPNLSVVMGSSMAEMAECNYPWGDPAEAVALTFSAPTARYLHTLH